MHDAEVAAVGELGVGVERRPSRIVDERHMAAGSGAVEEFDAALGQLAREEHVVSTVHQSSCLVRVTSLASRVVGAHDGPLVAPHGASRANERRHDLRPGRPRDLRSCDSPTLTHGAHSCLGAPLRKTQVTRFELECG